MVCFLLFNVTVLTWEVILYVKYIFILPPMEESAFNDQSFSLPNFLFFIYALGYYYNNAAD